jgi:hypothetical protein
MKVCSETNLIAKQQKPLKSGTAVLWPLPFEAVGQQQNNALTMLMMMVLVLVLLIVAGGRLRKHNIAPKQFQTCRSYNAGLCNVV